MTLPSKPEDTAAAISDFGTRVITRIKSVYDPEIPVNLYDLGLIYRVDVRPLEGGLFDVAVDMTLTTPNCPVAEQMPSRVQAAVRMETDAREVSVALVWDPPWDQSMMSDEARMQLNMF